MRKFPPASDLQFLVGKEVSQVSFAQWQIDLSFYEGHISAQSDIEHVDQSGTAHRHNSDETRLAPACLHRLVGQTIRMITVEEWCLTLAFDQGDLLRIYSDDGYYECVHIVDDKGQLQVF